MEASNDQKPEPSKGDEEVLATAIASLRLILRPLIHDLADLEDVVQNACVRLVQASRLDGGVKSPLAFLRAVWHEELAMVLRERARRQQLGGASEPQLDELAWSAKAEGWLEEQIRVVGDALPGALGSWFADHLSGLSDAELAARDGVTQAAIRRRRTILRGHFEKVGVMEKILDFVITNGGSRASMHREPLGSGGSQPPNPPTPQPPPCEV